MYDILFKMEENKNILITEYIKSLSPIEKQTMQIAKEHLQTSFYLEKSIGFLNWKKKQENNK